MHIWSNCYIFSVDWPFYHYVYFDKQLFFELFSWCFISFLSCENSIICLLAHASLIAQLVKNLPAMQESLVQLIHCRRGRLPNPVFLGFPCGSVGKEFTCNVGDLGSSPGLGRYPGEGKSYNSSIQAWRVPKSWAWLNGFHFQHTSASHMSLKIFIFVLILYVCVSCPSNWVIYIDVSGNLLCQLRFTAESLYFRSVQLLSPVWLFEKPWTAACQASLSITNSQASLSITNSCSLPKLISIELVMPSNHLILCCSLLLLP